MIVTMPCLKEIKVTPGMHLISALVRNMANHSKIPRGLEKKGFLWLVGFQQVLLSAEIIHRGGSDIK